MREAVNHLLEVCYPGRCAVCQGACAGEGVVCSECGGKLKTLTGAAACPRCAFPLVGEGSPCPRCLGKGLSPYEHILCLGIYRDPLKELIHQMKYRGRWGLGECLAEALHAKETIRVLLSGSDCLLPVPLHRLRQIGRGYNQAAVVAGRLGKLCGRPVVHPAIRLRHTPTQTTFHSRARREQNLRDAFGVLVPGAIEGKHVIVIDDVMTSGATLRSLGRTLKGARPASLCAVVLAVADPRGGDFQRM